MFVEGVWKLGGCGHIVWGCVEIKRAWLYIERVCQWV